MTIIQLPSTLDRKAATALASQIKLALQNSEDLVIDGDSVTRIGQCGLQLLLSAQQSAQTGNLSIRINASPSMIAAVNLTGLESTVGWMRSRHDG